jgi:hypothetical protein
LCRIAHATATWTSSLGNVRNSRRYPNGVPIVDMNIDGRKGNRCCKGRPALMPYNWPDIPAREWILRKGRLLRLRSTRFVAKHRRTLSLSFNQHPTSDVIPFLSYFSFSHLIFYLRHGFSRKLLNAGQRRHVEYFSNKLKLTREVTLVTVGSRNET